MVREKVQLKPTANHQGWISRMAAAPFIALIRLYQWTLSPMIGGHCRFMPTCSNYAIEAYRSHNPLKATWLTACRLLRCHPFGGSGWDPPPPPTDR
jgi:uncharacterized protein